jgi:hypothetical protein
MNDTAGSQERYQSLMILDRVMVISTKLLLRTAGLLVVAAWCSISSAETYLNLYSTVLNNGSNTAGIACTECHDSGKTVTDVSDTNTYPLGEGTPEYRHYAPLGADFDIYHGSSLSDCDLDDDTVVDVDGAACRASKMVGYVVPPSDLK